MPVDECASAILAGVVLTRLRKQGSELVAAHCPAGPAQVDNMGHEAKIKKPHKE
jgi:hypothetical protein